MSGEIIVKTDHAIIEFNRASHPHHEPCNFCKAPTNRVLAFRQRSALELEWEFVRWCDSCFNGVHKVDEDAGEIIVGVGHASISFNRTTHPEPHLCTFCKGSTTHVLAFRLQAQILAPWDLVSSCEGCFSGIRNVPVRDENGGMPAGSGRIIAPN
ncbi:hypothetical protein LCGC14_1466640 [marine sediment metagenome]|uniref:Uncharacterized protein n=1 Tax=marine sediment metagenome TaxID=412755 RepID=A0A0F9JDK8_9ZZZZ